MSVLINGKHLKQVIIDYYDDLIYKLDIYAEEYLKKIANNESFDDKNELLDKKLDQSDEETMNSDLYYQPIEKQFEDPYSDKYALDEPLKFNKACMVKDFVHIERVRAIEVIKEIQKERLEEMKSTTSKPSSVEEALFGKKFGFLVEIDDYNEQVKNMKFRLLTVIVDFYLEQDDIAYIEKFVNGHMHFRPINKTVLDERFLQVQLLVKYLKDKIQIMHKRCESVQRVCKAQLYSVEKVTVKLHSIAESASIKKVILDGSIDFTQLKSLSLCLQKSNIELNLSGLSNLNSLKLEKTAVNLEKSSVDDFTRLRRLKLDECLIYDARLDSPVNLPNLEICILTHTKFPSLNIYSLTNLRCFILRDNEKKYENLDFLKHMPYLVVLELHLRNLGQIKDDTFSELKKLEALKLDVYVGKGNWLSYLTNLKDLVDYDFDFVNDFDQIRSLTRLENLDLRFDAQVINEGTFKTLENLKSLSLSFKSEKIEKSALDSLEKLSELKLSRINDFKICAELFTNLSYLRTLELNHIDGIELTDGTFSSLRNLTQLSITFCELVNLPENVFLSLTKLKKLYLGYNGFPSLINENLFNGLCNLKELDLKNNHPLNQFSLEIFPKLPKLKRLVFIQYINNYDLLKNELDKLGIEFVCGIN